MKKKTYSLRSALAVAAAVVLTFSTAMLSGCGKNDSSSESSGSSDGSSQTTAENDSSSQTDDSESSSDDGSQQGGAEDLKAPVADGKIEMKDLPTENMVTRSVLREGDKSRLAAKLKKATSGDKEMFKICYLGDSITAGSSASSSNQYTNVLKSWMVDNVSYYIECQNAGIGATDSYLAVHRAQRDVLDNQPEIIFIEFINDTDNDFYKAAMDSLVRKCLSAENAPAVILVEMTMEDGTCPQNIHSQIAETYDLPVISYHDAVLPEVQAGNIQWKDISPDNIHPNDDGHKMLGKLLVSYIDSVIKDLDNIDTDNISTELPESPTGDVYANAQLANRDSETVNVTDEGTFTESVDFQSYFNKGWGTRSGGSMTFEVEARNIGFVYNKNVDGTYGSIVVNVDGEDVKTINGDFPGGWGSYACSEEVYSSDETAKHTVTVTVIDGDKQNFDIYSMLIS